MVGPTQGSVEVRIPMRYRWRWFWRGFFNPFADPSSMVRQEEIDEIVDAHFVREREYYRERMNIPARERSENETK